jgi:hypothetical protein
VSAADQPLMTDRYDDTVRWTEEQIAALRAGRFDDLDIQGIEEELRNLATLELEGCEWAIVQLMKMELRVLAWPEVSTEDVRSFDLSEIRRHARGLFSPAMRPKLDLQHLYVRAWLLLPETVNKRPPLELPEKCPWTLDTLLSLPPGTDGSATTTAENAAA